ncbi:MAG: DNA repair protein RecO [Saprospiraceae bacterium]|nr:DNA repair protein RecO [Saprospiraceae bacterium]
MKLYTSKGIIFRTIKYSETSIICDIYTREKGLRSFIASGVRTTKAGSKAAIYQHLNLVEIISFDQNSDKLSRIKEIKLDHHYRLINAHVVTSSVAIFMLEVSRNAIKEREPNSVLFDFLEEWLIFLDGCLTIHPCMHLIFMLELSNELGFGPMNNYNQSSSCFDMMEGTFSESISHEYSLNEDESEVFKNLLEVNRTSVSKITINKSVRNTITDHLITYFRLHISGFRELNSLEVLRCVL